MKKLAKKVVKTVVVSTLRVHANYSAECVAALKEGKSIVCANHVSFLDGIMIAVTSPYPLTFGVDSDYSKKSKTAKNVLGFFAWLGFGKVVAIDLNCPFGIRAMLKCLKDGQNIMIFPEGRISIDGTPQPLMPGVNWLQKRTQAKVIQGQIKGAEKSFFFGKSGREIRPAINLTFEQEKSWTFSS